MAPEGRNISLHATAEFPQKGGWVSQLRDMEEAEQGAYGLFSSQMTYATQKPFTYMVHKHE